MIKMPGESDETEAVIHPIWILIFLAVIILVMLFVGIRSNLLGNLPTLIRIGETIAFLLGMGGGIK
jgi:hypothetical protein